MIEFWFEYGDIHSKLQFDAFGYHVRSDKDGLATPFANLSSVEYKTALKGDDKLADYVKAGDAVTSNTATGYVVEFFLPLEAEGTTVDAKSMLWSLQINSIDDKEGGTASVYGYKLKTEEEMAEIEKVNKANFKGVSTPPAKSITIEAEAANVITSEGKTENDLITDQSKANGGKYIHSATNDGRRDAVLIYNITATKDTTVTLTMAMAHRDSTLKKISDYITVSVNGQAVSLGEKKFTLQGWAFNPNSPTNFTFEEIEIGEIQLIAGQTNTIKIETISNSAWELDYVILSGDVDGVAHAANA